MTSALTIRCTLTSSERPIETAVQPLPWSAKPLVRLFKNRQYADAAFRIRPGGAASPSYYLCATRLVLHDSQHFSRPGTIKFDPENLPSDEPATLYEGELDDFSVFKPLISNGYLSDSPSPQLPAALTSLSQRQENEHAAEPAPDKRQLDEDEGAKRHVKEYALIEITDCSFETFRAFLKFLHGGNLHFSPSFSDYLVLRNAPSLSDGEKADFLPSHTRWLRSTNWSQYSYRCDPHAVYRLADKYLETDLRVLAKDFIINSLTAENAAYEAFSQLSFDFPNDFQKPVFAFMVENWDEVKSTKAMEQVLSLLDAGDLPGGGEVFGKLLKGLSGGKEGDKGKGAEEEK
ncbi:hypothetical protein JCM6882_002237 [Rhodosporidiobolus microsporus]